MSAQIITAVVRNFITAGEAASGGDLKSKTFLASIDSLHDALRSLHPNRFELEFADSALLINGQKVRLSGAAGHRLVDLLERAKRSQWGGMTSETFPTPPQLAACFARFARPKLPADHPGLLARIGPIQLLTLEITEDGFTSVPGDLAPAGEDTAGSLEASMVRKLNLEEIQSALGADGTDALERSCTLYARAVTFVERFMSTMEPNSPRVPLDESARIVADIVDAWISDPTALLAMTLARPNKGHYDAYHHANTALFSIAIGSTMGMPRAALFELGLAALLHQIGIVDMPERIRDERVLPKEERSILARLPKQTVARLLQSEGPDLHAMARLNAIAAVGKPLATRVTGADGKVRLRPSLDPPPMLARIITVAARYDALTSEREFRAAMSPEKAFRLMRGNMRSQLDQGVVAHLARLQNVELSDG